MTQDSYSFLAYAFLESTRATRSLEHLADLAESRKRAVKPLRRDEKESIYDQIRLALHYSANVAKVFWPSGTDKTDNKRSRREQNACARARIHWSRSGSRANRVRP